VKVEVRLFATLASYLPEGNEENAALLDLPDGATVASALHTLGVPDDLPLITLVNGQDAAAGQELKDRDVLSVFPPLAGGY
jgi:molybdopterin converting factor small subunit